jgi:hypothetical protein
VLYCKFFIGVSPGHKENITSTDFICSCALGYMHPERLPGLAKNRFCKCHRLTREGKRFALGTEIKSKGHFDHGREVLM